MDLKNMVPLNLGVDNALGQSTAIFKGAQKNNKSSYVNHLP